MALEIKADVLQRYLWRLGPYVLYYKDIKNLDLIFLINKLIPTYKKIKFLQVEWNDYKRFNHINSDKEMNLICAYYSGKIEYSVDNPNEDELIIFLSKSLLLFNLKMENRASNVGKKSRKIFDKEQPLKIKINERLSKRIEHRIEIRKNYYLNQRINYLNKNFDYWTKSKKSKYDILNSENFEIISFQKNINNNQKTNVSIENIKSQSLIDNDFQISFNKPKLINQNNNIVTKNYSITNLSSNNNKLNFYFDLKNEELEKIANKNLTNCVGNSHLNNKIECVVKGKNSIEKFQEFNSNFDDIIKSDRVENTKLINIKDKNILPIYSNEVNNNKILDSINHVMKMEECVDKILNKISTKYISEPLDLSNKKLF